MKLVLILVISQIVNYANAQSIVGLWQEGTSAVSSGYHNNYRFNSDGTFKFKADEYFGLKRIISINGKYKVVKYTLILTLLSTTEVIGGSPERSMTGGEESDSWEITEGEVKTLALPKAKNINIAMEVEKTDSLGIESISFEKRKYYKIK